MLSFGATGRKSRTLELSEDTTATRRRLTGRGKWSDGPRTPLPIPTLYFFWDNKGVRFCGIRKQECGTWVLWVLAVMLSLRLSTIAGRWQGTLTPTQRRIP